MGLLKGISKVISPDLLHVLASMGHGDEIVLCDANFPTHSVSKNGPRYVDASGHSIPALLEAILKLFPLDTYDVPAYVMQVTSQDKGLDIPIWETYRQYLKASVGSEVEIEEIERFAFYERAKKSYAVIATGESAVYANLILKKGVISDAE